jgi:pimeloyl-ACP methyl ester carboxylesterase
VDTVRDLLGEETTRSQYFTGARHPEAVAPESWLLDQTYLDRGGRTEAQMRLTFDYKSNLELYEAWQAWLSAHRPPTLVVWGRHDPFFTAAGALAYLRDAPHADVHLLDTGHFALEERIDTIALLVIEFLARLARHGDVTASPATRP